MKSKKKIVLAYSGGLDTSIILKWLQENYKAEVICYTADIGQEIDRKKIFKNAKKLGVKKIIKRMKKASRLMVTAYKESGTRTTDGYSLMGFTKAYNAAKKSCT